MAGRERIARATIACALLGLLAPAVASACTICDTETAQQVRAGIFSENFWSILLAVASPFPVLLGATALLHWCLSRARRNMEVQTDEHIELGR